MFVLITSPDSVDTVHLRDQRIEPCKGCAVCLSVGSSKCPLRDDDAVRILQKMAAADSMVFVVPNYALQVPGILKTLLDRLSYVFHRPRLFGKVCLPVIVQGVYGGGKVAKYVNEVMSFWGAQPVKGVVISGGIYPLKPKKAGIQAKDDKVLKLALQRFSKALSATKMQKPSFFRLMIFRSTRASMQHFDEALAPDQAYFTRMGWDRADYYYPVKLSLTKKVFGNMIDRMIKSMADKDKIQKD